MLQYDLAYGPLERSIIVFDLLTLADLNVHPTILLALRYFSVVSFNYYVVASDTLPFFYYSYFFYIFLIISLCSNYSYLSVG